MDFGYFCLRWDLLDVSYICCVRALQETGSFGHPEARKAALGLSLDFDGTRKLSAVSMTRHGLLKLPNLIDIALFSTTTLSVELAGSWPGSLFWRCGCHRFAGVCAACFFHRSLGRAHENFLLDQGSSFHNPSTLSAFNSFGLGRAPRILCCVTLSCPGGSDRNRSCCPAAVPGRSSIWVYWGAHLAFLSQFDGESETVFRYLEHSIPC